MSSIKDISEYIVALIAAFASHHAMTDAEAYLYLKKYGAIKGGALGFWRILRCNPFSKGGYDPVP